MGVVLIKEDLDFMSHGYSFCSATLYVYCDRCGSFNIRSYVSAEKWGLTAYVVALVAGSAFVVYQPWGRAYWYLLPLCVIVSIAAFKYLWGETDYACRKCGLNPTTQYNTLNYPSGMSKVDVPEALIQKRCIGYWPDMYDLDQALRPPTPSSDDSQANGVSP